MSDAPLGVSMDILRSVQDSLNELTSLLSNRSSQTPSLTSPTMTPPAPITAGLSSPSLQRFLVASPTESAGVQNGQIALPRLPVSAFAVQETCLTQSSSLAETNNNNNPVERESDPHVITSPLLSNNNDAVQQPPSHATSPQEIPTIITPPLPSSRHIRVITAIRRFFSALKEVLHILGGGSSHSSTSGKIVESIIASGEAKILSEAKTASRHRDKFLKFAKRIEPIFSILGVIAGILIPLLIAGMI